MILNNKLILFLAACLLFSGLSGIGYKKGSRINLFLGIAFAAEPEEKKETDGDNPTDAATPETPCPECPECPDSAKIVLRGLEDKKIQVEKSQENLVQERKELERYEEQIDEKLVTLERLKKQINDEIAQLETKKTQQELEKEAAYEAKLRRLVKMYAGMKPKKAALIVDKMTLEVAQEIFLRMREASASQILSFVGAEKAAKISERLAFKKKQ